MKVVRILVGNYSMEEGRTKFPSYKSRLKQIVHRKTRRLVNCARAMENSVFLGIYFLLCSPTGR